jgi:adenine nucleotide transporter 17
MNSVNSFVSSHKPQIGALIQGLSGSMASLVAHSFVYPLQKMSTRMQVEGANAEEYSTLPQAIKHTVQEEGFGSLFSGAGQSWLTNAAEQGLYNYWYQRLRDHYGVQDKAINNWRNFLISLAAAAITTLFLNPFWVINTRTETNKAPSLDGPAQSFFPTLKRTITEEGIVSLYSGLVPALMLTLNPAIHYTTFERLKSLLASILLRRKGKTPTTSKVNHFAFSLTQLFLLGVASKAIATFLTYPLMVIRSRMQVGNQGFAEVVRQIKQEEGICGFFKGLDAKIWFSVLNAGLVMMLQDRIADLVSRILHSIVWRKNMLRR